MGCKNSLSAAEVLEKKNGILIQTQNFVTQNILTMKSQYKPLHELGERDFSKCFSVLHLPTKTKRLMKIIKIDVLKELNSFVDKPNEVFILRTLDHPNIQKVYEYFTDGKFFYMILEYIDGLNLTDFLISQGKVEEKTLCEIFKQIISAILYLHQNHIIYSNVSFESIFVIKDTKDIKITGFTLSKFGGTLKKYYNKNIQFLAPEVFLNKYSFESDVWSCGVLLFKVLTTKYPYMIPKENFSKVKLNFSIEEFTNLPSTLKNLLKSMLEIDPKKRITAENVLKSNWFKIISNSEVHLKNLTFTPKKFSEEKLKLATEAFIIHQMENTKLINEMRQNFKYYDKSGEGLINKEELRQMLIHISNNKYTDLEIENLMNQIDQDKSGSISFEEFLRVTLDYDSFVTKENLLQAFNFFDKDKSGKLSIKELKGIFSEKDDELEVDKYVKSVIEKYDKDSDGHLNYEEFLNLISKS